MPRTRLRLCRLSGFLERYVASRYPGWNLDAALRYLPVVRYLRKRQPLTTLEVGAGQGGLSRYWGGWTVESDARMPAGGERSSAIRVQALASALPFRDRALDAVVCLDVLEHVPEVERIPVVAALLRVAGRDLVVGFPSGDEASRLEQDLDDLHRARAGASHPWLREHLAHGLPNATLLVDRLRDLAADQGRTVHIREKKNVNLRVWYTLYRLYLRGGPRTRRLIGSHLLVFLPVLEHLNFGRAYRRIFFVALNDSTASTHSEGEHVP